MPTQMEERAKRIRILKSLFYRVHLKDDTIDESKLIEQCMENWGCTERKVREYLDFLLASGFILRDDDHGNKSVWIWMNPKRLKEYAGGEVTNLDSLYT